MGLLSFIKGAGAKLFGKGEEKAPEAADIKQEIDNHGLKADDLKVSVDGEKVVVTGKAATTEEAEKIVLTAGNTHGISQVDNQITVEKPAPAATLYTVKKGDTLWEIAEKHYGKGKGAKYTEIVKANTPPVKDPDLIQPGWVLRIPPLS